MTTLDAEIAAYERMSDELKSAHFGKWVVIHNGKLEAVHQEFAAAADEAVERFGRGPFLIRKVGAPQIISTRPILRHAETH